MSEQNATRYVRTRTLQTDSTIGKEHTMAQIKFIRKYKFTPNGETWYDVLYTPSNRLRTYIADDLPGTVKAWLEGKEGVAQYDRIFQRDEIIYKAEPLYRVEFDFRFNGEDVHTHLDNNGKGFSQEDATHVAVELASQNNMNVVITAITEI